MAQVSRECSDQVMDILALAVPTQEPLAGEGVAQIMNPGTRPVAVALRPAQYVAQHFKVPADRAIRQTVSSLVDKERAVVAHFQLAVACLRVAAQSFRGCGM